VIRSQTSRDDTRDRVIASQAIASRDSKITRKRLNGRRLNPENENCEVLDDFESLGAAYLREYFNFI